MALDPTLISKTFDGDRLRQARQLALKTKQGLAASVSVSASAIGQFEAGTSVPRPELIPRLAKELNVRPEFFTTGRPKVHLPVESAFFRSLRATTAKQRSRATSYTEQLWELVSAIEEHVRLPIVDIPGFSGGEIAPGILPSEPRAAAQSLRRVWQLGTGPIPHMVNLLEQHGIVTVIVPDVEDEVARIDAFSTLIFSRPIIVLSPSRADDVYRHRFTAAHELGHLILHGDQVSGGSAMEREADKFAAEFLTPSATIKPDLPTRVDFRKLDTMSRWWGVSVKSLIYRSREVGNLSEPTARRAFMRLNQLTTEGVFRPEPVNLHPGEIPSMLRQAVELAERRGVTISSLADQLEWTTAHLREMLGMPDDRPVLRLVVNNGSGHESPGYSALNRTHIATDAC